MHQRLLRTDTGSIASQSTVSRCLKQFVRSINKRSKEIIKFPSSFNDVNVTMEEFRNIAGTCIVY